MIKGFATKGASGPSSGNSKNGQVWGRTLLPWVFAGFAGLLIADLGIIYTRSLMLPSNSVPPRPPQPLPIDVLQRGTLESIRTRNIFSAQNIIPDPLSSPKSNQKQQEAEPVLSSLPIALVGTLVHSNPEKSLASIQLKSKNQVLSFGIKKDIEGMAVVEKIERGKVIIRNSSTAALEFIELKLDNKINFGAAAPVAASGALNPSKDVKQTGQNQFEIKRGDLLKYTNDLSSVLMQARAVPARRPGGEIYGFRILEIQPGSIFSQLGMVPMDVITGVNGSPVTNVQQAMELYAALKTSPKIKIGIERNGQNQSLDYTISE